MQQQALPTMKLTPKSRIRLSQQLMTSQYQLSVSAHRLLAISLARLSEYIIDHEARLPDQKVETLPELMFELSSLVGLFDCKEKTVQRWAHDATVELMGTVIGHWREDSWEKCTWATYSKCENGQVTFQINPKLLPHIHRLVSDEVYTEYGIDQLKFFNSNLLFRLYELFKCHVRHGTLEMHEDYLKTFLGVDPDKYSKKSHFEKRILDANIKKLNTLTDLDIQYSFKGYRGPRIYVFILALKPVDLKDGVDAKLADGTPKIATSAGLEVAQEPKGSDKMPERRVNPAKHNAEAQKSTSEEERICNRLKGYGLNAQQMEWAILIASAMENPRNVVKNTLKNMLDGFIEKGVTTQIVKQNLAYVNAYIGRTGGQFRSPMLLERFINQSIAKVEGVWVYTDTNADNFPEVPSTAYTLPPCEHWSALILSHAEHPVKGLHSESDSVAETAPNTPQYAASDMIEDAVFTPCDGPDQDLLSVQSKPDQPLSASDYKAQLKGLSS
ncbi:replication initiation protein [Marinobacterium sp. BA1]|uniref:replication initiation protein n=1 Tax=Marinobacterium sp. BA1 TaxID=3138931 RepID=UPI0032E62801